MDALIYLSIAAALAALIVFAEWHSSRHRACPDCFHPLEDHDWHCERPGCCCERSQAELRSLLGNSREENHG